jgi:hypothetical protein
MSHPTHKTYPSGDRKISQPISEPLPQKTKILRGKIHLTGASFKRKSGHQPKPSEKIRKAPFYG